VTALTLKELTTKYPVKKEEVQRYIRKHKLRNTHSVRVRVRERLAARKASQETGREYSYKSASAPWQVIYGKARLGGMFAFIHSTANNLNLNLVLLLAGHEIESIDRVFLDTDEVLFGASPDPRWSTQFKVADGTLRTASHKVFMAAGLGAPGQAAQGDLIGQSPDKWTAAHTLSNHAYAYLILVHDAALFPDGLPEIGFEVKGKKCYDPRSTLTVWTDNSALIWADFLMDTKIGFGVPFAKIDMTQLSAAANICDETITLQGGGTEKRYTFNGYFDTSEDQESILEQITQAMSGVSIFSGGLWKIKPGAHTSSVVTLTDDDWLSPLQVQIKAPRSENFNAIKGTYVASDRNWEEREFPLVKNDFYKAQDNNELVIEDIQLPFTIYPAAAQRISKIELEDVRQGITVAGRAKLKAFQAEVGDTVDITRARFGWSAKLFRVLECELTIELDDYNAPVFGVELLLKETAAGIWNWNNGEETNIDLSPNTNLPSPFNVAALTGLTLLSGTTELYIRSDGTVFSRIKVSWTPITDAYVTSGGRVEIQYKQTAVVDWSNATPVNGDQSFTHILDVQDGAAYDVRIRAVNAAQIPSAYSSVSGHVVIGKTAPPSQVEQLYAQLAGYSIILSWPAIMDLDADLYVLKVGSPSDSWENAVFIQEVRGTTYTYDLQEAGTYRFFIKAVDTSRNSSISAQVVNVIIGAPSQVSVSQTISGPNVVLAWSEAVSNFAIAQYEITAGEVYETSTPIASVNGTTHTRKVDWGGVRRFWVAARDVAANLGPAGNVDITIVIPTAVQALIATPIDNNVKLIWEGPTFATLPIERYEISRGATYAGAVLLGEVRGTIAVYPELTAGTYIYWLVPFDTANNAGHEKGASAVVTAPPDYQLLDDQELDPSDGTFSNVIIQDDIIQISNVVVNPIEIQDIIANPGMGLQTTQKSLAQLNAEVPPKNPHGLPSEAEVFRIQWPEINTGNASYDWTIVDAMVRNARTSNQRITCRIITNDEANNPSGSWWLQAFAGVAGSGTPGWIYKAIDDGGLIDQWAPDFVNTVVRTKFQDFLAALAAHEIDGIRFDTHPNIAVWDTGVWGLYAENHFSGAMISPAYTTEVPEPSQSTQEWIVDQIFATFSTKEIIAVVDSLLTLNYTVNTKGGGVRADGVGNPWHMNELYVDRYAEANLANAWQFANVEFEPYGTIQSWVSNGWDVQGILNWMLDRHIMAFNSKNSAFNPPAAVVNMFIEFVRRMGYRHVIRSLQHAQTINVNSSSPFIMQWKNAGVARSHYGHKVALKFAKANGPEHVALGEAASFLPGDSEIIQNVTLPTYLTSGTYTVSAGVVHPTTRDTEVKLAISGRDTQGWYPLSSIQVVNASPQFSPLKYPSIGIKGAYFVASAGTIVTKATQAAATWDDVLEEWQDQTGNSRHLEMLTATKKPQLKQTTINSLAGILFDGTNDLFLGNTQFRNMLSKVARAKIFMVMRCLTQNNDNHILSFGGRARMLDFGTAPTMNYNIGGRRLDADSFYSQSSVVTHGNNVTQLRTLDFNWGGHSMDLFIDGSKGTAVVTVPNWLTAGQTSDTDIACGVGANSLGAADFTNMWLCEFIIAVQESATDPFLSTADVNEIESALASKYGLTIAP